MLSKKVFRLSTKSEIAAWRTKAKIPMFSWDLGHAKERYCDGVLDLRLLSQMASQKSTRFPDGYELFTGCFRKAELCLKEMTIPIPHLKLFDSRILLTAKRERLYFRFLARPLQREGAPDRLNRCGPNLLGLVPRGLVSPAPSPTSGGLHPQRCLRRQGPIERLMG